jgi:hypothetical protein
MTFNRVDSALVCRPVLQPERGCCPHTLARAPALTIWGCCECSNAQDKQLVIVVSVQIYLAAVKIHYRQCSAVPHEGRICRFRRWQALPLSQEHCASEGSKMSFKISPGNAVSVNVQPALGKKQACASTCQPFPTSDLVT